jgi:hypothetical protein
VYSVGSTPATGTGAVGAVGPTAGVGDAIEAGTGVSGDVGVFVGAGVEVADEPHATAINKTTDISPGNSVRRIDKDCVNTEPPPSLWESSAELRPGFANDPMCSSSSNSAFLMEPSQLLDTQRNIETREYFGPGTRSS